MKVTIFQGEGVGGHPTREELIRVWKEELAAEPDITDIRYYDRMGISDVEEAFGDADAVMGTFIPKDFFTEEFLNRHPNLRYVSCASHGYGRIDFDLLRRHGVVFTNTIYCEQNIAEFTFALLLEICHQVAAHDSYYRKDRWQDEDLRRVSFIVSPQIQLAGLTFGIVGLGNIGQCAARIAHGFGMKVIAYSRHRKDLPDQPYIEQVSFEEIVRNSDVLSIHCPLTDDTRELFNADVFHRMKNTAILLNTARGEIVNEEDLFHAVESGEIYAAGLDVVCGEPLQRPNLLMQSDRIILTPHIAWVADEARLREVRLEAANFKAWLHNGEYKDLTGVGRDDA